MTIEIHRPELEALILELMKQGSFHNVEDVLMDALTSVTPRRQGQSSRAEDKTKAAPFWKTFTERLHAVPSDVFEHLPPDGASEHDHYLYGSPKKNA